MFSPNQQMRVHAKLLSVQVPSSIGYVGQNGLPHVPMDGGANGALSQAESLVFSSKKLENDLILLGQRIKHHEENIKCLKTHKAILDDQITDMQVTLGKYRSLSAPTTEDEEAIVEHIMQHEKSAAATVCQLKYHRAQADPVSPTKDVLGVVATLGKVNDDKLSWLLSEYLGLDTMLALVCTTYDGIKALETYDKEGFVSKSFGLYVLGASIGRILDGRFNVICLENLRPYGGEFMPDDPQRRLDLLKPKLPNGESPIGFLGFAVNMIHVDSKYLHGLISDGYGLRETLFYTLFSRLQVYRTRVDMLQAIPCISDGAISLDGGIIRRNGVFSLGTREVINVKFAISSGDSYLPSNHNEIEEQMKELKWKKQTTMEEIQTEEAILSHVKYNFEVKKQEFIRFMAQMQYPMQANQGRFMPR